MDPRAQLLISAEDIDAKIRELADQIVRAYEGKKLRLVCVCNGAMFFFVRLAQAIGQRLPDMRIDTVALHSYHAGAERPAELQHKKALSYDLEEGEYLLFVEDIVDTGHTADGVLHVYSQLDDTAGVAFCTLLNKACRREVDVELAFVGFEIGDEFVFGFGLDLDQCFRHLDGIWYIPKAA